jgi:hypothetical protein
MLGSIKKSLSITGQNREYRLIRDKARLEMAMRIKMCSAVKIDSRHKEHKRRDIIVTQKSKLTKRDHL